MTKKASAKNREWEKDRRDRLNVAFDTLAKALPNYEPSSTLSKIEIIQRAIRVLQELQQNVKNLQVGNNSEILKTQEQLEEGFKVLLVRNNELVELLKKHKVAIPSYNPPPILSCVVQNQQEGENNCNEINVQVAGRSQTDSQNDKATLIAVKPDAKLSVNQLESISKTAESKQPAIACATLVPIKIIKVPVLRPVIMVRKLGSDKRQLRHIRPAVGKVGKVAIPRLNRPLSSIRKLPTKKLFQNSQKLSRNHATVKKQHVKPVLKTKIGPCNEAKPTQSKSNEENIPPPISCMFENSENVSNVLFEQPEIATVEHSTDKISIDQISALKPVGNELCSQTSVVELSSDILESLNETQNETNPSSMSPTAAYLMAFPVVSGGKRIEDTERTDENSHVILPDENKQDHHNSILDNISSLLTTRDFDRFVGEVVEKTDCKEMGKIEKSFEFELKPLAECKPKNTGKSLQFNDCSKMENISVPTSKKICQKTDQNNVNDSQIAQKKDSILDFEPCLVDKSAFTFSLSTTTNTFVPSHSSDTGFYDSLTNIGHSASHRTDPKISNHYSMAPLLPNLYLSTQAPTSSGYAMLPEIAQTPFTFSLTSASQSTSTVAKPIMSSFTNSNTPSTTFSISKLTNTAATMSTVPSMPISHYHPPMTSTATVYSQSMPYNNTVTTTSAQSSFNLNTYNPFAFDNVQTSTCKNTNFTFSLTSTTSSGASCSTRKPQPHNNPFSVDYNILSDQKHAKRSTLPFGICSAVTPIPTPQTVQPDHESMPFYCSKAPAYQPHFNQPNQTTKTTNKMTSTSSKSSLRSHVNWMTSSGDCNLNIPTAIDDRTPANYQTPKPTDVSYIHPTIAVEDAFNWSPNKLMLDSSGTAALPNLHGDLALNNFIARPHLSSIPSTKRPRKEPMLETPCNSSFSVSHLVDQRKSTKDTFMNQNEIKLKSMPKDTNRPSGSSNTSCASSSFNYSTNIFVESFTHPRHPKPATSHSNNYSAEAILSSQCSVSSSASYNKRDKFPGSYLPSGDYFHPDASAIPTTMEFDPFFSHPNYLPPQKPMCPELDYLGASETVSSTQKRPDTYHQAPPSHVYPFNSTSNSSRTMKPQKTTMHPPNNQLNNNNKKFNTNTFNTASTNYYQTPLVDSTNISQTPQRDGIPPPAIHPTHQSSAQDHYPYHHYPHHYNHNPSISTPAKPQSPVNYPGQIMPSALHPAAPPLYHSSGMQHFGTSTTAGAAYPAAPSTSHLVSNFNLSTICPEINDKVVGPQSNNVGSW